jgi:hypothetical protein
VTDAELEKLERDLRTLIPVAVALADRESLPREDLVNKLVRLVLTCVTQRRAGQSQQVPGD